MTDAENARLALDAIGTLPDVEIDIAEAALQFARIDAPGISPEHAPPEAELEPARAHLSDLARDAVAMAADLPSNDVAARAGALAALLARHRYQGDTEHYDDPSNANLIHVTARRRGIPVALGIIWLHCARTVGWSAHGLDFPAHFLLALEGETTKTKPKTAPNQVVLDVFAGGIPLDAKDLRSLLKRTQGPTAELRPGVLAPMSARAVLLRLQENIRARRLRAEDFEGTLATTLDMLRIAPDHAKLWREAAQLHQRLDHVTAALRCYARLLDLVPEGDSAQTTRQAIDHLRSRLN